MIVSASLFRQMLSGISGYKPTAAGVPSLDVPKDWDNANDTVMILTQVR